MRRTLSIGNRGEDVKALQRLLNFHLTMPYWDPLATDGLFGPKTKARVIAFQTVNHLTVDGIVGLQTRETLLDSRTLDFQADIAPVTDPYVYTQHRLYGGDGSTLRAGNLFALTQASPPNIRPQTPNVQQQPVPWVLAQRTVQIQAGQEVNVNPFFLQPLVLTGQFSWLFRRDGRPDVTISAGGQVALNQQTGTRPNGRWSGQGFLQWGPTGLWKLGGFDLLNPFVTTMLQINQDKPLNIGIGLGNQINWTLWSEPHPTIPNTDRQNISVFINLQVVTNVDLSTGKLSPIGGQFLGGIIFSFDWTPKDKP